MKVDHFTTLKITQIIFQIPNLPGTIILFQKYAIKNRLLVYTLPLVILDVRVTLNGPRVTLKVSL